ncbi:MAG: hypothetical protein ACI3ZQ_01940 [Candidatus Cryptobacteroides sp.]
MNKEFTRVRTNIDLIVSILMTAAGITLVLLPTPDSVNIAGCLMILTGIILSVFLRTGHKDTETGETYSKKILYFPQSCKSRILSGLEHDVKNLDLSEQDKGNGLKMDVYFNKKSNKAFIRMFEYVPYRYEPASGTFGFRADEISKLVG